MKRFDEKVDLTYLVNTAIGNAAKRSDADFQIIEARGASWIEYIIKNYVPGLLKTLDDEMKSEDPGSPLGKYAFPNDRVGIKPPPEPNTELEDELLRALNHHYKDNRSIPLGDAIALKDLIKRGLYKNILREPTADWIFRGIGVSEDWMYANLPDVIDDIKKNQSNSGTIKKTFVYKPKHGASSSWTTMKKTANNFADSDCSDNDKPFSIVLAAKLSDNPNRFLSGKDGTYKLEIPSQYSFENEVTGLGPIKVAGVDWELFAQ